MQLLKHKSIYYTLVKKKCVLKCTECSLVVYFKSLKVQF